jgi:hypothetical protein
VGFVARRFVVVLLLVLAAWLHIGASQDVATAMPLSVTVATAGTGDHLTEASAEHAHPLPCLRPAQRHGKTPVQALRAPTADAAGAPRPFLARGRISDRAPITARPAPTLENLQTLRC